MTDEPLDLLCINTIRTLSMDAVQEASSGHPGTPMAMAPVVYTLWQRHLRFDPEDPVWPNRDRFVLSIGHASMLLYSLLHLTGVKAVNAQYETPGEPSVTLDDIRRFRQLDSKCPGHPEYRWTSGVETTTGPLGQGVATSVGMAIAGRWLAERFDRPDASLFDYDVYALAGDGDMMEGLVTIRPADANEVAEAWRVVMAMHHEPAALILSRQALPTLDRSRYAAASGLARGAYVLADAGGGDPEVLLLATGSEVSLCVEAHEQLVGEGIRSRVVSMPSCELFDRQPQTYRDEVLPPQVTARVSVEQASTFGWERFVGLEGRAIGMHTFGASAPLAALKRRFGFTPDHVVATARAMVRPAVQPETETRSSR